ncbi:hypothetical protein CVT26_013813 [Gymnopilus dilepis]|uniref:Glycosyl hydrolase family 30 TIM-barrel domain-containing protein n=1 Tax=Gymnopilus dilepis TaxID=231916 RepID=A0A409Y6K0_9AGAR|nr:hypothetical protein CVT26_013813 [Gymnopilus dilepis]
MRPSVVLSLSIAIVPAASQQIWDIWQTTWDRSKLFTSLAPSSPINFVTPGPAASADIVVNDAVEYQPIAGFGASLTDSSALTLNNLKSKNSANYWSILGHMFSTSYAADAAGLSYIRVPIGASDFSANTYSLDDVSGDTSLSHFNINNIPSYVFSVLKDIQSINSAIKIHLCPWSPPAWMKDSGTMNGGNLQSQYTGVYANYLLKAVQGFQNQGLPVYAISIQNEPQNSNPTYPTCTMTPTVMGQIGTSLRSLLNSNGLSGVQIIGYEHNWDDANAYPVTLFIKAFVLICTRKMNSYSSAFSGVAFHCYAGSVSNQAQFHNAWPSKAQCTGTFGSDWWSDIKGLMWNLALDGNGNPKLPGTNSCGGPGCRPLVTVNSDGSYSYNQEFYAMAQASKAIIPKDPGGPFGQRIGVTVQGSLSWALVVGAYVVRRVNPSDWLQYSIVVLNWDDSASTTWNPQPVTATIEFRGMQATYTFPVGATTLWWFAPATSNGKIVNDAKNSTESPIKVFTSDSAQPSKNATKLQFNATHIPL